MKFLRSLVWYGLKKIKIMRHWSNSSHASFNTVAFKLFLCSDPLQQPSLIYPTLFKNLDSRENNAVVDTQPKISKVKKLCKALLNKHFLETLPTTKQPQRLLFGDKLVCAWYCCWQNRAHLRSGSTASFFLIFGFIPNNAQKTVLCWYIDGNAPSGGLLFLQLYGTKTPWLSKIQTRFCVYTYHSVVE